MKSRPFFRSVVCIASLFLFADLNFDSFKTAGLSAQESPAAMAIKRRIGGGGGVPSGGASAPSPEQMAARAAEQKSETPVEPDVTGPKDASGVPNTVFAPDGKETTPDVKKEHPPVEIVTEPFFTYTHKDKDPLGVNASAQSDKEKVAPPRDKAITAVAADEEGVMALSASKDASIQLWFTQDFSYNEEDDFMGGDFDNPMMGMEGGNPNDMMGNKLGRNGAGNNIMGKNDGAGGRNVPPMGRGAQNRADAVGRNAEAGRNPQAGGRQTLAGSRNNGQYGNSGSFYSMRRGNLNKSGQKQEDEESGNKTGAWTKKRKKQVSTLGKRRAIYELLDAYGERRGKGLSDMLVSPYGDLIYTADYDGNVRRWSIQSKKSQIFSYKRVKGVKNTMWGVAFCPLTDMGFPFDIVAGANNNGSVYFWNSINRRLFGSLALGKGPVYDVNFAPDASAVVTACADGTARVIAVPDMEVVSLLRGHQGPVFSSVFDEGGQHILTASRDKSACLWDSYSGEIVASFIGHTGAVRKAIFLDDRHVLTCGDDKTARLWEFPDSVASGSGDMMSFGMSAPDAESGSMGENGQEQGFGWASDEDDLFGEDEGEDEEESTEEETAEDDAEDSADDNKEETNASSTAGQGEKEENVFEANGISEEDVPEQSIADAPRGYEVARFEATSPVFSIAVNRYFLFTGCQDGKVRVWEIGTYLGNDRDSGKNAVSGPMGADGMEMNQIPGLMPGMIPGVNPQAGQGN